MISEDEHVISEDEHVISEDKHVISDTKRSCYIQPIVQWVIFLCHVTV